MTAHPDPEATTGEADAWRQGAQWGMRQPHAETERLRAEVAALRRALGLAPRGYAFPYSTVEPSAEGSHTGVTVEGEESGSPRNL